MYLFTLFKNRNSVLVKERTILHIPHIGKKQSTFIEKIKKIKCCLGKIAVNQEFLILKHPVQLPKVMFPHWMFQASSSNNCPFTGHYCHLFSSVTCRIICDEEEYLRISEFPWPNIISKSFLVKEVLVYAGLKAAKRWYLN